MKSATDVRAPALLRRSVVLATLMTLAKAALAWVSGSMAITASALDSFLDISASGVNAFSQSISQQPPDEDHAYGHEKAEALAGLFQGFAIGSAGIWIFIEAVQRYRAGDSPVVTPAAFVIIIGSAVVSAWHGLDLKRAAEASNSTVLRTESEHFLSDLAAYVGLVVGLGAYAATGETWIDLVLGFAISAVVIWRAWEVLRTSTAELMDQEAPEEVRERIVNACQTAHPSIVGFHELRTRRAAHKTFVDVHIEIRGVQLFKEAHAIAETLVLAIERDVPGADVTVHYDPEGEE